MVEVVDAAKRAIDTTLYCVFNSEKGGLVSLIYRLSKEEEFSVRNYFQVFVPSNVIFKNMNFEFIKFQRNLDTGHLVILLLSIDSTIDELLSVGWEIDEKLK